MPPSAVRTQTLSFQIPHTNVRAPGDCSDALRMSARPSTGSLISWSPPHSQKDSKKHGPGASERTPPEDGSRVLRGFRSVLQHADETLRCVDARGQSEKGRGRIGMNLFFRMGPSHREQVIAFREGSRYVQGTFWGILHNCEIWIWVGRGAGGGGLPVFSECSCSPWSSSTPMITEDFIDVFHGHFGYWPFDRPVVWLKLFHSHSFKVLPQTVSTIGRSFGYFDFVVLFCSTVFVSCVSPFLLNNEWFGFFSFIENILIFLLIFISSVYFTPVMSSVGCICWSFFFFFIPGVNQTESALTSAKWMNSPWTHNRPAAPITHIEPACT